MASRGCGHSHEYPLRTYLFTLFPSPTSNLYSGGGVQGHNGLRNYRVHQNKVKPVEFRLRLTPEAGHGVHDPRGSRGRSHWSTPGLRGGDLGSRVETFAPTRPDTPPSSTLYCVPVYLSFRHRVPLHPSSPLPPFLLPVRGPCDPRVNDGDDYSKSSQKPTKFP